MRVQENRRQSSDHIRRNSDPGAMDRAPIPSERIPLSNSINSPGTRRISDVSLRISRQSNEENQLRYLPYGTFLLIIV